MCPWRPTLAAGPVASIKVHVSSRQTRRANSGNRPSRPKLQERYDQKRLQVVDAAAQLFAKRGYDATSIDDLEQATGLRRGGLYHYISGKQELLVSIHERFIDPLLEQAREVEAAKLPADETLRQLAHVLMNTIATYRDEVTVFTHEWRVIERSAEWKDVRDARKAFEEVVRNAIIRGTKEGTLKAGDPQLATYAFLGIINYSTQWYDVSGAKSADEIAETFATIFLRGIGA